MIQLPPHIKILLATRPVDFRKGIDSLVALCRKELSCEPFDGTMIVFRNRMGTSLKLLVYDGQGFWLCQKRFSCGKILWWMSETDELVHPMLAQQLAVLIYNGNPQRADFADDWRKIN
jgi:transposase